MKFSNKDFSLTEEILNWKLHLLCSVMTPECEGGFWWNFSLVQKIFFHIFWSQNQCRSKFTVQSASMQIVNMWEADKILRE